MLTNSKVMVLGGSTPYSRKYVYTFDLDNNVVTHGPDLLFDRYYAACTLFFSSLHNNRYTSL